MRARPEFPPTPEALRGAGLRVTESRSAVFDALRDCPHASADEVFSRVLPRVPGTSLQSVYNALGDFVDAGLVRRIEPAGRSMLFELHLHDNHHHLVCTGCGAVEDVDCAVGAAPCLTPADTHGFAVAVAEVTFWGLCPACAAASSAPAAAPAGTAATPAGTAATPAGTAAAPDGTAATPAGTAAAPAGTRAHP